MQLRLIGGSRASLARTPPCWLLQDSSAHVFYTETPLAANTTYRVTIDATRGTESLHFEWTFTTGEASRWKLSGQSVVLSGPRAAVPTMVVCFQKLIPD